MSLQNFNCHILKIDFYEPDGKLLYSVCGALPSRTIQFGVQDSSFLALIASYYRKSYVLNVK